MEIIARIETDFNEKFGIPRQSGLVEELKGRIIFEPKYRNPHAVMGLEEFSHLWLLWQFSRAIREEWSPTVLPPRLGGNTHVGVFATRSPFRPNPIGLSCVKLERVELDPQLGPVLYVAGADLLDQTPIYDIKPYVPVSDHHPDALGSFSDTARSHRLTVHCDYELLSAVTPDKRQALLEVLALDPRPAYHDDPERIYGMDFGNYCVRFCVDGMELYVREIIQNKK